MYRDGGGPTLPHKVEEPVAVFEGQFQLKGSQKIILKEGERRQLTFHFNPDDLKFYNDLKFVA